MRWIGLAATALVCVAFMSAAPPSCPPRSRRPTRVLADADLHYQVTADPAALREHRVTLLELVEALRDAIGAPVPARTGPPTIPVVVTDGQTSSFDIGTQLRVPRWIAHDVDLGSVVVRWRPREPPVLVRHLADVRLLGTSASRSDRRGASEAFATAASAAAP